jgi:hypothetical protein
MCHNLRKNNTDLIHLDISGILINKLRNIAEAFPKHFQSVNGSSCPGTFPFINQSTEVLPLAPISNSDFHNAIKRLRPTKSVELDGIPSFVIKDCCQIFVPILKFIFSLSLSQNTFHNLWKQAAITPVLKKWKTPSVGNNRPIALLNHFSKVFKFIIHDYVSNFLKSKLNHSQHGFIKSKSTVTNLVTFLELVTPLVCSHGQTDFDFSNAFNILPHAPLHHKLSNYGLSSGYLIWFLSCLTNR